ncbi:MAG: hypothetical protein QNJ56_10930 [Gammaproteobacteria bacterium]|nr:hypothetical protein [Gammaproteobacteria bacterium]
MTHMEVETAGNAGAIAGTTAMDGGSTGNVWNISSKKKDQHRNVDLFSTIKG